MPSISLADIKAAADAKYGPFVIELSDGTTATLQSALKLKPGDRKKLETLSNPPAPAADAPPEPDDATERRMKELVRLVAASKSDADRLLKEVGDDLTYLVGVMEAYGEASQVGEASTSPS